MKENDYLTGEVIGAAIEVHKALGPGLLEGAYEACLAYEMAQRKIYFERQKPIPLLYHSVALDCGFKADFLVEGKIIVEIKCVERMHDIHMAQVITYLKLTRCHIGLLINFNTKYLKTGIKRIVHDL